MAQLPSAKNIDKLYHEKGHEALVWYAWRNALRVLPALGALPFEVIWPHNTVHNLYSICQIPLLLSKYNSEQSSSKEYVNAFSHVASSNMAVAFRAIKIDNQTILNVVRSNVAAYIAAKISTVDAKSSVRNAMITAKSASIVIGNDAILSSVTDYEMLCSSEHFDKNHFNSHYLWSNKNLPEEYDKWKISFFSQLESMGFQLLVENIRFLSGEKDAKEFSMPDSDKISTSITNSQIFLKQVIEGEELEENHAVRVVLLGNGGAGKTSLVNALMNNDGWDSSEKELGSLHRPLDLKKNFPHLNVFGDHKLNLFLWDFSGQIFSHGLHAAFINENCVYIVVVDSRHEQAIEEWLYQIRHITGQAKVIIVTNWFEHCDTEQNQRYLLRKFPDLLDKRSFCYFALNSLLNDDRSEPSVRAFENFLKTLWDFCSESQRLTFRQVLIAHEKINDDLNNLTFARKSDLLKTLENNAGTLNSYDVIELLEKLGFILRITKDGRDYCLKPNRLMEYSYKLFYLDDLIEKNGILSWNALLLAAEKEGFNEDTLRLLVDFLQDQGLCKKIYFNRQDLYFFTHSCNSNENKFINDILRYPEGKKLTICFDLPYFPLGFHAHMVSILFKQNNDFGIAHFDHIWKSGFLIKNGDHSHGLVQFFRQKYIIEMTLIGKPIDFAKIVKAFYSALVVFLTSRGNIQFSDIRPFVVFDKEFIAIKTGKILIKTLENIDGFDQLFSKVKAMTGKANNEIHYHGDVTHNTGGDASNFATKSENFTQNSHIQTIDVTTDQRQQIATIIGSLLKDAGSLDPESLMAVAEVNKALAAPQDKPEARNLLGKVWNGLKDTLSTVKTGTDIAEFALKHQAELVAVITAAVALLK